LNSGGVVRADISDFVQLQRTVQDLARLVPFSVFIIVPFAELLLPFALKFFPNMLPSTYEGQKAKDAKTTNLRATRREVSNLLRNTLRETGLPIPLNKSNAQKEEFTEFFRKVKIPSLFFFIHAMSHMARC
jgi:LETM1 and EF-hand domain-containing protein 1